MLNERMNRASSAQDPYVGAVAFNYAGGDQSLAVTGRAIYVTTQGVLNVVMQDGSSMQATFPVGETKIAIRTIKQQNSTAAGFVLL